MITIEVVRAFFAWCLVMNIGLLAFSAIFVVAFHGTAIKVHQKLFGLSEEDLSRAYFQYLAQYKIATIVFNLVPYLALRLIG